MAGSGEEPLNRELYRIPGHAGWFSWNGIHTIEREALVEFFEGKTMSKTPKIYKEYRDFMINKYRENPKRALTFTEVRKMLVGDVNCLRRVFEFLEQWGLINYSASQPESEAPGSSSVVVHNSAPPGIQIVSKPFATSQASNLGSRENVYKQQQEPQWTQQETMLLLEAVTKYGDDWFKVQQHVGTKNKSQCVKHFVQLPFGDQFLNEDGDTTSKPLENGTNVHPSKKQKLADSKAKPTSNVQQQQVSDLEDSNVTPLNDMSNPLLSQIAFMASMAGPRVAAAAAQAALAVLAEEEPAVSQLPFMNPNQTAHESVDNSPSEPEAGSSEQKEPDGKSETIVESKEHIKMSAARIRAGVATALAACAVNAKNLADQEEREMEALMANLIETQLKKLHSKLEHFEELELLMDKERLQLEQMREQVFIDRLQLMRQQLPASNPQPPVSSAQEKLA